MSLRILIVDDEPAACARLKRLLQAETDCEIVAECHDLTVARRALTEAQPDLVFLDINLPAGSGLELLRARSDAGRPLVVLATADAAHALEAFALGVHDYLLKPFTRERLLQALAGARVRLTVGTEASVAVAAPPLKRFLVRDRSGVHVVPAAEVDWVESANNYVILHAGRDNHVVRETLANLERRLPAAQFLRVSRFALLNLARVRRLRPTDAGGHVVVMADGTEVPVTRALREVQALLETA